MEAGNQAKTWHIYTKLTSVLKTCKYKLVYLVAFFSLADVNTVDSMLTIRHNAYKDFVHSRQKITVFY